ncbi:transposase [Aminithiophilus ramosus]|uniref:Transposase n=1 Tax=Aminithiophilus ramosus TaxID=3029084 RepID=A0A9Q7EXA4_9BACT|nr:transposase [Aminithiophilus ramosus]
MKGSTFQARLAALGILPSRSRPRVSNDNAYSESLFRTYKYRPAFPSQGFAGLEEAREWTAAFVRWYNEKHRHSAIGFVTPDARHRGDDVEILKKRKLRYEKARSAHPERWRGKTRRREPIGPVFLNPDRSGKEEKAEKDPG